MSIPVFVKSGSIIAVLSTEVYHGNGEIAGSIEVKRENGEVIVTQNGLKDAKVKVVN